MKHRLIIIICGMTISIFAAAAATPAVTPRASGLDVDCDTIPADVCDDFTEESTQCRPNYECVETMANLCSAMQGQSTEAVQECCVLDTFESSKICNDWEHCPDQDTTRNLYIHCHWNHTGDGQ